MLVHTLIESIVDQFPANPAISMGDQELSYAELENRANQIAHNLIQSGVLPGDIVGISMKRSPDLIACILGVLKTGAAYLPLDPEYPLERLKFMVSHSGVKKILINETFSSLLSLDSEQEIVFEKIVFDTLPVSRPIIDQVPAELVYIIYTSGSTGTPKGVSMGHKALINLINWQNQQTNFKQNSITLQFTPISFDVHFQEIFSTLSLGGRLVLIGEAERLDPSSLLRTILKEQVNRIYLPYVALNHLAEMAATLKEYPVSIKEVTTAGEQLKITRYIREFFSNLHEVTLFNHYGPSETHVVTSFSLQGDPQNWPALPPIGETIENCQSYLLDENMQPVDNGNEGELYFGGACLAHGYIHSPELTNERFFQHPEFGRIYKTGDTGIKSPEGIITFLGRKDGQVKIRGYRIELGEIEVTMQKVRDVDQSAARVIEKDHEKVLCAYYCGNADANVLRQFLREALPEYMVPSYIMKLDQLPLTPSGKVDFKALPAISSERPDLTTEFIAPAGEKQIIIDRIWKKYLKIDSIGIDDSFFDLGGNSLMAIKILVELNQINDKKITVVNFFQYPTIRKLASFLKNEQEDFSHLLTAADSAMIKDDIAVIGMTGRFPGAASIDELWENLLKGKNCIDKFDPSEANPSVAVETRKDPNYVCAQGEFPDQKSFDYKFFGMTPREAELMDPQQRKFLELTTEALEVAGYNPDRYRGSIGIFAGMANSKYGNLVNQHPDKVKQAGDFNVMLGLEKDYIATRVAYKLNLTGPALSIHTGCSTSLVAIIEAVKSLRQSNCDMALAGGIAIYGTPKSGHLYQEGGILSQDGVCRPFDVSATGTVFTEGGGVVVLKRLKDAESDGDNILALIKGIGINNDGSDKMSFTAPSIKGQVEVILKAQKDAGVTPDSIGYIEAHGTATPVGDPIEVQALTKAFSLRTDAKNYCYLSSLKANLGHLTSAAGVAGFIKTVLCVQKGVIPGTANFKEPNKLLGLNETPFIITNEKNSFPKNHVVRRAGISSFGVGGTNGHLILEEYVSKTPADQLNIRLPALFKLSAKNPIQLKVMEEKLLSSLAEQDDADWRKMAFTLEVGRKEYQCRSYLVLENKDDLVTKNAVVKNRGKKNKEKLLYFLLPGQGSHYPTMGQGLYESNPVFKQHFDSCAEILKKFLNYDVREVVFRSEANELLNNTFYTQPAIFCLEYALAQSYMSLGLMPAGFIGHSIGEFVAATLAGVFSLEDGLKLIAKRAELMNDLPSGVMLSVATSKEKLEKLCQNANLDIAAVNGPEACVVAGSESQINTFQLHLEGLGIASVTLKTSHAFHSRMMRPAVAAFRKCLDEIKLNRPSIKMYSTVTCKLENELLTSRDYWANHIVDPVLFSPTMENIIQDENLVFLEIGPRNTLTNLTHKIARHLKIESLQAFTALGDKRESESKNFYRALGDLWLNGITVSDPEMLFYPSERVRIPAPTYAFERNEVWLEDKYNQQITKSNMHTIKVEEKDMTPANNEVLKNKLSEIFEKSSGIDVRSYDDDTTFIEMGMDSLFLTQIALQVKKELKVNVTFRQLIENFPSLNLLTNHLLDKVFLEAPLAAQSTQPTSAPAPAVQPASVTRAAIPVMTVSAGSGLEQIISRQLELMSQQIHLLGGALPASTEVKSDVGVNTVPQATATTPMITEEKQPVAVKTKQRGAAVNNAKEAFGAAARITVDKTSKLTDHQNKMIADFINQYSEKTKSSKKFTQDNRKNHADPRVVTGFKPEFKEIIYPVVVKKSQDQKLWDLDNNQYVDMLCGFGSNFFGNGNKKIKELVQKQIEEGIEIGPQHPLVGEVSHLINELTGNERSAFCNTGSEAVLGAMRIARTVTGREKIIVFSGSYHGIVDEVILRGSKLGALPAAPGINHNAVSNMIVLDYGTDESLKIIREMAHDVAAVLIEPVQSRRCDFHPVEFLKEVRKITKENQAALIFDEVITGFRIHPGGAQAYFGIQADICTYGKIVGGGMPIGVISGRAEYMDALDGGFWQYGDDSTPTVGVTYFAGTFVRHPLALAAAKGAMEIIRDGGVKQLSDLNERTHKFASEFNALCEMAGIPLVMNHFGSLMKPKWKEEILGGELLFALLRYHGVHAYDGFPWFVNLAHTDEDLKFVLDALKKAIASMQFMGLIKGNYEIPVNSQVFIQSQPPVTGARIGKDEKGNPAWFIENPEKAGEYYQL